MGKAVVSTTRRRGRPGTDAGPRCGDCGSAGCVRLDGDNAAARSGAARRARTRRPATRATPVFMGTGLERFRASLSGCGADPFRDARHVTCSRKRTELVMKRPAAVRRVWALPAAVTAASLLMLALMGAGSNTVPREPLETVDTSRIPVATRHVRVPDGASLQQALDAARPGDWIELQSGATYAGPFHLRRFDGNGWVVVTSSAPGLPAPGTRVGPMHAALMPKLRASSHAVIVAEPGAHHYRFVGLDIAPQPGTWLVGLRAARKRRAVAGPAAARYRRRPVLPPRRSDARAPGAAWR